MRQAAKNSLEKDFFKITNNANFSYDSHNDLDNCKFFLIFDELNETSYLKKYYNFFGNRVSKFVLSDLLERKIDEEFNDKEMNIQKNDPLQDIKLTALNDKRKEDVEPFEIFKQKQTGQKRKRTIKDYMARHENDSKNKTIIDFNNDQTTSIKFVAVHKTLAVNLTTLFMKEKMLKFSKTSSCSFICGMIDAFCFLLENQAVKSIYEKA